MTSNLAGVNYELFAWEEAGGWRGRTRLWRPGHLTMDIRVVFLNLSPVLSLIQVRIEMIQRLGTCQPNGAPQ